MASIPSEIAYFGWLQRDNLGDEILAEAFVDIHPTTRLYQDPPHWKIRMAAALNRIGISQQAESLRTKILQNHLQRHYSQHLCYLGGGTLIGSQTWLPILEYLATHKRHLHSFGTGVLDMGFWKGKKGYPSDPTAHMNRWAKLLRTFKTVSVRGILSQAILNDLDVPSVVTGDPALLFVESENIELPRTKSLGINFGEARHILWGGDEEIVANAMAQLTNYIQKKGWTVTLFSVYPEDTVSCQQWLKKHNLQDSVELYYEYNDARKFMARLQSCDVFAGMKLHATILAYTAQVPCIMLEYRPKCRDFMETLNAGERNIRCDTIDPIALCDLIEHIYSNQENYRQEQHELAMQFAQTTRKFQRTIFAPGGE